MPVPKEVLRAAGWVAICTALVTLVSLVDLYSGPDLTFSLFYFAVIVLVSWQLPKLHYAVAGAIGIAGVWLAADWFTYGAPDEVILLWNGAMRLVMLLGLGVLVCRLREALVNERRLARTDTLTGALNVRAFGERAKMEIARARRYRHPLTVAYVDLDDFKGVNDRFGHSFGDQVLKSIATSLKTNLRQSDSLSRVGGDEFVILLPETGEAHAREILSKLQAVVSATIHDGGLPVTFSIGAVAFDDPPADPDTLIRSADSVMYRAKAGGKNRLDIHSSTPGVPITRAANDSDPPSLHETCM